MFSYGCLIYETLDFPIQTFIIKPDCQEINESNIDECCTSVANVTGNLVSLLVDMNIPHNLLISDGGCSIYVSPR